MGKYFSNLDYECVGCSIANLFVEMGEVETADRFSSNYKKHPLVLNNGIAHFLIAPTLVNDLSEGRYEGILDVDTEFKLLHLARDIYGSRKVLEFMAALRKQEDNGSIIYNGRDRIYEMPAVIYIESPMGVHALVDAEKFVIDDGEVDEIKGLESENIVAAMEVSKVRL